VKPPRNNATQRLSNGGQVRAVSVRTH